MVYQRNAGKHIVAKAAQSRAHHRFSIKRHKSLVGIVVQKQTRRVWLIFACAFLLSGACSDQSSPVLDQGGGRRPGDGHSGNAALETSVLGGTPFVALCRFFVQSFQRRHGATGLPDRPRGFAMAAGLGQTQRHGQHSR